MKFSNDQYELIKKLEVLPDFIKLPGRLENILRFLVTDVRKSSVKKGVVELIDGYFVVFKVDEKTHIWHLLLKKNIINKARIALFLL